MFLFPMLCCLTVASGEPMPLEGGATLTPYLVAPEQASGAAVVICPGGGYGFLAMDHEGVQPALMLNKLGISAYVLQYTIATKARPGPLLRQPLTDVQNALRLVRRDAKANKIDPHKIGVMGFSAGGHLASTAATHFDKGLPDSSDPLKRISSRPDFAILAYPVISMEDGVTHGGSRRNLFGDKPDAALIQEFSNDQRVTKETPPTFIFHTDEDKAVLPENAIRFYLALKKAGVPAELHIYEKGRHGVGLGTDPKWTGGDTYAADWSNRLASWLKLRGLAK